MAKVYVERQGVIKSVLVSFVAIALKHRELAEQIFCGLAVCHSQNLILVEVIPEFLEYRLLCG